MTPYIKLVSWPYALMCFHVRGLNAVMIDYFCIRTKEFGWENSYKENCLIPESFLKALNWEDLSLVAIVF